MLPKVSLGFWHNFGGVDPYERSREITHYAFDHGITHFDLANNYVPPYDSAEETFGRLMDDDFRPYRDELFISTKASDVCTWTTLTSSTATATTLRRRSTRRCKRLSMSSGQVPATGYAN